MDTVIKFHFSEKPVSCNRQWPNDR